VTAEVVIVDYGVGNVGSILNMYSRIGKRAILSRDPDEIGAAARVLLPGVGSFDHAMLRLRDSELEAPIKAAVDRGTPLLGVCLGMQLLLDGSEEGVESGLGLIRGRSYRFPNEFEGGKLRVPHMGWNTLERAKETKTLPSLGKADRYYFVHSYFVHPDDPADVLTRTTYGTTFASGISHDNVSGVQFHPEKSHRFGLKLLSDFAES
jgi:imidazole glycerol-phosphate synthase subunit HisH